VFSSEAEVTNISRHGSWLLLDGRELSLPFEEFPWFKRAPVEAILRLERPRPDHLYWPELDVDVSVDSIEHPERYPPEVKGLNHQQRPAKEPLQHGPAPAAESPRPELLACTAPSAPGGLRGGKSGATIHRGA
jgi:Protein of unknown function (DUF2442)